MERIEAQLRSDEGNMVMDCLWNAKRFHATVSFTGLKDVTDVGELEGRSAECDRLTCQGVQFTGRTN